ncbi:hypothetical protein ACFXQA_05245 [Microbacterium sp. P07]|uniref:hypothetical protein n=1 Tax=Microbacterium sp. P07 TaxID=3366952 RepID=UPI0037463148
MAAALKVDPSRVPGDHVVLVTGNDAEAKNTVRSFLHDLGSADRLGEVRASLGPEMCAHLLIQIVGTFGTFDFNIAINRADTVGR